MGIEKIASVWPEWKIVEQIGQGAFGKVYKAVREEHGVTTYAAIKVVTIPQDNAEIEELKTEGLDNDATSVYFRGIVDDFVNEIKLMECMKGVSNIVSVEDFKVIGKQDSIGWDIFIRMELLTPLNSYIADRKLKEKEIIKLGIDICSALELCAHKNIIHRDIKPENIFVSSFGDFKVGDFGIAKEMEKTNGTLSSKGTYGYMAPEVVKGNNYDATVDTYSLGLVLYKLLNNNRLPFIDPKAKQIQYQDRKIANERRLSGEKLTPPADASKELASVILKACEFEPERRFKCATDMKLALIAVLNKDKVDLDATVSAVHNTQKGNTTRTGSVKVKEKKKKKYIIPIILCIIVVFAGILAVTIFRYTKGNKDGNDSYKKTDATADSNKSDDSDITDYESEKKKYNETGEITNSLVRSIEKELNTILDDYRDETIDYYTAKLKLQDIEDMKVTEVSDQLEKIRTEVETLYSSRQAFDSATEYEKNGNYSKAIAEYKKVTESDSNYKYAKKQLIVLEDAYRKQVLDEAASLVDNKDYIGAIDVLDKALNDTLNDDDMIKRQIGEYYQEYVDNVISDSNKLVEEKKYSDAITLVSDAKKKIDEDQYINELDEQIEEIKNKQPKNFIDVCKPYDWTTSKCDLYSEDELDGFYMAGTERKNGFTVDLGWRDGYVLSNLNAQYTTLSFKVGHVDDTNMNDVKMTIYLDDEIVNTYEIKADAYPQDITVDVTGAKQIKFLFTEVDTYSPEIGFADMVIE